MVDELVELSQTPDARVRHGTDAEAIEQAEAKAGAAMREWIDEHDAELTLMMRRPALVERRGFAA